MSNYIISEYLNRHPETEPDELPNIYTYFKFKAYLQTTLRCTRKSYCIKEGERLQNFSYLDPHELYQLSDIRISPITYESPYDLEWAIDQLDSSQAEVIWLYFYGGKTDLEIAQERNVSRQAVNGLRQRALHRLREVLS